MVNAKKWFMIRKVDTGSLWGYTLVFPPVCYSMSGFFFFLMIIEQTVCILICV